MKNIINKIKNVINNWLGTEEVLRKYINEIHRTTHSYIYDYKMKVRKIIMANNQEIESLKKEIYKLDNATTDSVAVLNYEFESLKNKIEGLEVQVENLEEDYIYDLNKRIKWAENEIKYNHMEHLALKEVYNKYVKYVAASCLNCFKSDYFDYMHETAEDIKPKYKDVENKYDYEYPSESYENEFRLRKHSKMAAPKKTAAKKAPAKKTAAKKDVADLLEAAMTKAKKK
jgi:hypothetical protein